MYYIIFFDDDYNIKKATKFEQYPRVKEVVTVIKHLETLDQEESFLLKMDIITEKEFKLIK